MTDSLGWQSANTTAPPLASLTSHTPPTSQLPPPCGSGPSASSNGQLSNPANTGDLFACQVFVEIPQIVLEFLKRFTLGQVVREFLKIAEPHALALPMDISSGTHGLRIRFGMQGRASWLRGQDLNLRPLG